MSKRKSILKTLIVIFLVMFIGNIVLMRLLFDINVVGVMLSSMADQTETHRSPNQGESLNADVAREREMPPMKQSAPEPEDAESQRSFCVVNSDPFAALQSLNLADKLFVLSILPKIGREAMDRLIELSDGGLAPDDYEEIKRLAENCLKTSDMERLKEIFDKNKGLFSQNPGE